MKTIKLIVVLVACLTSGLSPYAAEFDGGRVSNRTEAKERGSGGSTAVELALIEAHDGQPSGAAHAFCLALTSEQIGFAIDTLEALGTAGLLTEGQANLLVSKLQVAQVQLNSKNIVAVFRQLEDFIKKINLHTKKGKVSADNGLLLINSTLSVMCRT